MTTTVLAIVISATLAILIPVIIYVNKRYFVGGFLTIKIDFKTGTSSPAGVLIPYIDEDGFGIRNRSIVRHHLTWTYKLTITNNSDHTAYFPRLYYKNDQFPDITIEKLEELKPIGSKESVTMNIKFFENSDTLPTQRKQTDKPPTDFTTLRLLLEYYNGYDSKFYTLYDNADKSNKPSKLRPNF
ncbi:hypothetical protein [uncultured Mucilaginibacter sp.]|uniref:hypothetical protein n=1 Tax=uncultured Mucilaginibacter sp. TaxID=797541 RepID=UPI0025F808E6|nr:hypothetical protein [uncultured Mucilaginibacter sp.]